MEKSTARWALPLLMALTVATWGLVLWEWGDARTLSVMPLVTACMFTAMALLWPFLAGARFQHGHVRRALQCVECRTLFWPTEEALGFCLRCGSTRRPVAAGY